MKYEFSSPDSGRQSALIFDEVARLTASEALGSGTTSCVSLFKDSAQPDIQPIAVKKFKPDYPRDRAQSEFRMLKKVFGKTRVAFFEEGERYRIVMPYVSGRSFDRVLAELTDIAAIHALILALLHSVESLHAQYGVAHLDIKESNLLVEQTDKKTFLVHIVDFGNAFRFGHRVFKIAAARCGYWAPELYQTSSDTEKDVAISALLDIYSLASLLQRCLPTRFRYAAQVYDFIKQGLAINPEQRLSLENGIAALTACIEQPTVSPGYVVSSVATQFTAEQIRAAIKPYFDQDRGWFRRHTFFAWPMSQTVSDLLGLLEGGVSVVSQQAVLEVLSRRDASWTSISSAVPSYRLFFQSQGRQGVDKTRQLSATDKVVERLCSLP